MSSKIKLYFSSNEDENKGRFRDSYRGPQPPMLSLRSYQKPIKHNLCFFLSCRHQIIFKDQLAPTKQSFKMRFQQQEFSDFTCKHVLNRQ